MTEHTPGPWQALHDWARIVGTRQPSSVCHCGEWTVATTDPSYEFHGSDEADARLIAAAPEMLAALEAAREIIQGHFQDDCEDCMAAHGAVCAAIAKATGKQSSASA